MTSEVQQECVKIMYKHQFDVAKRRKILIWAAKHRKCPKCDQPPYKPCMNLNNRKYGKSDSPTANPHDERIDWEALLMAFKARGYGG
jgi:hypothetical protein